MEAFPLENHKRKFYFMDHISLIFCSSCIRLSGVQTLQYLVVLRLGFLSVVWYVLPYVLSYIGFQKALKVLHQNVPALERICVYMVIFDRLRARIGSRSVMSLTRIKSLLKRNE